MIAIKPQWKKTLEQNKLFQAINHDLNTGPDNVRKLDLYKQKCKILDQGNSDIKLDWSMSKPTEDDHDLKQYMMGILTQRCKYSTPIEEVRNYDEEKEYLDALTRCVSQFVNDE